MNRQAILDLLDTMVSPKRKRHILGVEETAKALALQYGADSEKASAAALLHDLLRDVRGEAMLETARSLGLEPDAYEQSNPVVLHGPAAAAYAVQKLGITDDDVLWAVTYHTVAAPQMSKLAKIIYLADAIEPNRDYPGAEELRALAAKDLEAAYRTAVRQSYQLEITRGETMHPRTLETIQAIEQEEKQMTQQAREMANEVARVLYNKKADDIQLIDIADRTVIADYFVVASGNNTTQVKALCDEVEEELGKQGLQARRIEGYPEGRWIVMDYAYVLVHIFLNEERMFYNIERLWSDGDNLTVYKGEAK